MQNSRADEETRHREDGVAGEDQDRQTGNPEAERLEAELAAMEERYKRALADLDNYRKRSAGEVARRTLEQREAVLREWLEVIDSVERAMRSTAADDPLAVGLRAVLDQMDGILRRQGVTRTGEAGELFDPDRHEAVGVVTSSDAEDRTIVDVARSGYSVGDRLLRPAQVVVARNERNS